MAQERDHWERRVRDSMGFHEMELQKLRSSLSDSEALDKKNAQLKEALRQAHQDLQIMQEAEVDLEKRLQLCVCVYNCGMPGVLFIGFVGASFLRFFYVMVFLASCVTVFPP